MTKENATLGNVTEVNPSDNNITLAAKEYIEKCNWYLVPLAAENKRPLHEDWSKPESCLSRYSDSIPPNLHGIGLAHGPSRTCTVDLDALAKAAEFFQAREVDIYRYLSARDALKIISGRANRSKLLYRLPPDIEPLRSVKRDADGFELRCTTRVGTSLQDVLPPSIHPKTHKPYTWEGDWRYAPVLPDEIYRVWVELLEQRKARTWDVAHGDILEPFVDSALAIMNPDREYNEWLAIGMALDSAGFGDKWDEWSQKGASFRPGDCDARLEGFTEGGGVTLGTFWKLARDEGWQSASGWDAALDAIEANTTRPAEAAGKLALVHRICARGASELGLALKRLAKFYGVSKSDFQRDVSSALRTQEDPHDLTHEDLAEDYYQKLGNAVATEGALWVYRGNRWAETSYNDIVHDVGKRYREQLLCRRGSDYNAIARLVVTRHVNESWFAEGEIGIACADGFYKLSEEGEISRHAHLPEQRQRYLYDLVPEAGPMPLLQRLLECAEPDSRTIIQQFCGAVLFQLATKKQKALLLYGDTGTGKSTLVKLLQRVLPRCSVVPPNRFTEDYYRATLAGALLNSHTELPEENAVDSEEFKAIMAGDRISARIVQQPVFYFNPIAGHIFSTNHLPTVKNDQEAFWRRWLITRWAGAPETVIEDLDKKIYEEELPQFIHWAMQGASTLMAQGWVESPAHDAAMALWSEKHNVFLQCLYADDSPLVRAENASERTTALADAVRDWALVNGLKPPIRKVVIAQIKAEFKVKSRDGYQRAQGIGLVFDR